MLMFHVCIEPTNLIYRYNKLILIPIIHYDGSYNEAWIESFLVRHWHRIKSWGG